MTYRVIKQKYRDRNTGKIITPRHWTIDFIDHLGRRQRFSLRVTNKKVADAYARNIESIIDLKCSSRPFSIEILQWLEKIPDQISIKLASIGLLDNEEYSLTKPLDKHMLDWKKYLRDCGNSAKHVSQQYNRIKRIIDGCGFVYLNDIKESIFLAWLMKQQSARDYKPVPISNSTRNHFIRAIKSFCNWAAMEGRMLKSPLAGLKFLKADVKIRRALTPGEAEKLLKVASKQPPVLGIPGKQRALIYRMAIETGLRANELKSLTKSNICFDDATVVLDGSHTKNKQTARLPLRKSTLKMLRQHAVNREQDQPLFDMPYKQSDMIREDYIAAGINYHDTGSGHLDFHSLRHTFGTFLALSGTHPKVAQQLMRHSKIEMTMNIYTHISPKQTRQAIDKLPKLA